MSRFTFAFVCFFAILFRGRLPERAALYLPEAPDEGRRALPAAKDEAAKEAKPEAKAKPEAEAKPEPAKDAAAETARDEAARRPAAAKKAADLAEHHRDGALAVLALLQREGRLVDFLRESLETYEDADVGAAARDIHRGCKKALEEHLQLEPVMPGDEDDAVTVPRGFDPGEIRLIGQVNGEPPFKGALRHHGWRVTDIKLPTLSEGVDRRVLAPAEVELS
jgi:hypothetical protein